MDDIDTTNDFLVSSGPSGGVRIMMLPTGPIGKEQALRLAAWLVAMTGSNMGDLEPVYEAVANT